MSYSPQRPYFSPSPLSRSPCQNDTLDLSLHPSHLQNAFLSRQIYSSKMASLLSKYYPSTPRYYILSVDITQETINNLNAVFIGSCDTMPVAAVFENDLNEFLQIFPQAKEVTKFEPIRGVPYHIGNYRKINEKLDRLINVTKPKEINDDIWARYVHMMCVYCGKRYNTLWDLIIDCGGHDKDIQEGSWKEIDIEFLETFQKGCEQMKIINEVMESVYNDNLVIKENNENESETIEEINHCKICGKEVMDDPSNHFQQEHSYIYDRIVKMFWKKNLKYSERRRTPERRTSERRNYHRDGHSYRDWRSNERQRGRSKERYDERKPYKKSEYYGRNDKTHQQLDDIKPPPSSYLDFLENLN
ncbi:C2H2-type domain-containing protein [Entamoeba marina]